MSITPEQACLWVGYRLVRSHRTGRINLPERWGRRTKVRLLGTILRIEAVIAGRAELNEARRNFTRAAGDCVCDHCGLKFFDHPSDIEPESPDDLSGRALTILCNKSRVKL